MNQPYYPDLVFSLSELLNNGVDQHAALISELSAASSGEAQLKESLADISKVSTAKSSRKYSCRDYYYIPHSPDQGDGIMEEELAHGTTGAKQGSVEFRRLNKQKKIDVFGRFYM